MTLLMCMKKTHASSRILKVLTAAKKLIPLESKADRLCVKQRYSTCEICMKKTDGSPRILKVFSAAQKIPWVQMKAFSRSVKYSNVVMCMSTDGSDRIVKIVPASKMLPWVDGIIIRSTSCKADPKLAMWSGYVFCVAAYSSRIVEVSRTRHTRPGD